MTISSQTICFEARCKCGVGFIHTQLASSYANAPQQLASSRSTVGFITRDFHALISRQHSQTNRHGLYTLFLTSKSRCMQKISSVDALFTTQNVLSRSGRFGGGHTGWSQLQLASSVSPLWLFWYILMTTFIIWVPPLTLNLLPQTWWTIIPIVVMDISLETTQTNLKPIPHSKHRSVWKLMWSICEQTPKYHPTKNKLSFACRWNWKTHSTPNTHRPKGMWTAWTGSNRKPIPHNSNMPILFDRKKLIILYFEWIPDDQQIAI